MSLKDKIQEDMKLAIKSQEKDRLSIIRMMLSAIKQKEIDDRVVLDDDQIFSLLRKMQKQRIESEKIYLEANRKDLAQKERFEINIIDDYLPTQLSPEELDSRVNIIINEFGKDVTINDMGKIMARAKQDLSSIADMSLVSKIVKDYFQNRK